MIFAGVRPHDVRRDDVHAEVRFPRRPAGRYGTRQRHLRDGTSLNPSSRSSFSATYRSARQMLVS
jgi:hypothetical protein